MAALFLKKIPDVSSWKLVHKLGSRLTRSGIKYHPGTLGRQLSGFTLSVPTELESAMRRLLIASNGMRTNNDVERALTKEGLHVPASRRLSPFLPVNRTLPLYQLWLYLNPTRLKKDLAERLHKDLARDGVRANAFSIPSILEGRRGLPRREILEKLLAYLKEHGINSEAEALKIARTQQEAIQRSVEGRGYTPSGHFVGLCRAWQLLHHDPVLKRLARKLRDAMSDRDVPVALAQYQKIVDGHFPRVRRSILWAMEELIRKELPQIQDLDAAAEKACSNSEKLAELKWVQAGPIAEMSRKWVSEHPGINGQELAIRVYKTVRRMGYPITLTRIQSVLNGRQKKTRGFIYRAMLKQFSRGPARIPVEHRIASAQIMEMGNHALANSDANDAIKARNPAGARVGAGTGKMSELEPYIKQAQRYLRTSAGSDQLVNFLAFRIAQTYEIPQGRAMELLIAKKFDVVDEAESDNDSPEVGSDDTPDVPMDER